MKKKIVVITGAGISAESGIRTFRDSDGLWEEYRIEDVATPQAWQRNQRLVLDFYNQRRKQVIEAHPNVAHLALVELEKKYDVVIVTQNVDDLHERSGSSNVLHLHGEIRKSRSTADARLIYDIAGWQLSEGDLCEKGSQLRPHIVWFGELVPKLEEGARMVESADILIVVGTSLAVYPAAGLVDLANHAEQKYLIDPEAPAVSGDFNVIRSKAGSGVPDLVGRLLH
ncbi:MAG: SIR2 family NAD-dependent protein deacylase [Bacteroidota bacterium]